MVTEAILNVVFFPVIAFLNVLPDVTFPTWMDVGGTSNSCTETSIGCYAYNGGWGMVSFRAWLPVDTFFEVVGFCEAVAVLALTAGVARKVVSVLSGGGGA